MPEVLAPAGDAAAFSAALDSGADAIYLGLKNFSARRSAANFSDEELKNCIARAHVLEVKVYVALNTLVKDGETDGFFASALGAWNAGADALIIQDIFLGKLLKRTYPEMELHLSTQAGVCNVYGARLAKRYGFSRVILARETPIEDICRIAAELETEVFVQGALCTCFSGQCYLSSFAGGNSGNRGLCKQPCRKRYSVDREGNEEFYYALSLSDLCVGKDIFKLIEAGVASFKIEGRMRSAAYVGAAVRYYKDILERAGEGTLKEDLSDLKRTFNRGDYTRGYAFGQDKNLLSRNIQGHKGEQIGRISSKQKNAKFTFVESDYIPADGDGFKVIRADREEIGGGEYRASFPSAKGGFFLPKNSAYRAGDGVYLTSSRALCERISRRRRLLSVCIEAEISVGNPPRVRLSGGFGQIECAASFSADEAKNRAFSAEEFVDCFSKTGDYPFAVSFGKIAIEGECFIVKSALNAFRRDVYASLFARLSAARAPLRERCVEPAKSAKRRSESGRFAVIDRDFSDKIYSGAPVTDAILKPHDYKNSDEIKQFIEIAEYYAWHKWLYLPAFMVGADIEAIENIVSLFDGVYAEGIFSLELCREKGWKLFAGTGFGVFDRLSLCTLLEERPAEVALSKELSERELAAIRHELPEAIVFVGGSIKVMELGHCLFGKTCSACDRRERYTLTDESGRRFPLLRYENSVCRFEVYNSANLVSDLAGNRVFDFCALSGEEKRAYLSGEDLRLSIGSRTAGALRRGIL